MSHKSGNAIAQENIYPAQGNYPRVEGESTVSTILVSQIHLYAGDVF